jgi:hypothetical protein
LSHEVVSQQEIIDSRQRQESVNRTRSPPIPTLRSKCKQNKTYRGKNVHTTITETIEPQSIVIYEEEVQPVVETYNIQREYVSRHVSELGSTGSFESLSVHVFRSC